ncbi:hypothetical protein [Streptomyces sp. NPDC058426]|uniref:hypothetical protein n=1 Tax=Streptomyces sp. NPDC058426 TaxID=3346493 RepID=UPI00365CD246
MTEPEPRGGGWKRQGFIPVSRQSSEQPATPYPAPPPRGSAPPPAPPPRGAAPPPAPPPPADPAAPDPSYEPVFARLWQRWTTEGRTVPGEPDPEWAALARRSPWPR